MSALLLVGTACTDDEQPVAAPSPSETSSPGPSPSPSPTPPPLQTVVGETQVTTVDATYDDQLGFRDDGPPSEGAVEAATAAVAAALDRHLNSAQAGEPGLGVLQAAWLDEVDPAAAAVLRTGLTNRENPVARATYVMDVQLEPDPTLVSAFVGVERVDGSIVTVEMVFDVAGDTPVLHLVGEGVLR